METRAATNAQVSFNVGPVNFYDDGNYTCKAINKHGSDELDAYLNISSKFIWFVYLNY